MGKLNRLDDKSLQKAREIIDSHFGGLVDDISIESIGNGASTRRYFRIYLPRYPLNSTGVLLLEKKKFDLIKSDFYQVSEILRKLQLPTPSIFEDFSHEGAIYLQDAGNMQLREMMELLDGDEEGKAELYKQAVEHLVKLQTRAPQLQKDQRAFQLSFDSKKLLWELDFMMKHFAKEFVGWKPSKQDAATLTSFFKNLCAQIAALPRVFCHRDYHSENLMYLDEQLFIIDFQDARMGPHVYDLVSLLSDSYVEISSEMRQEMLKHYIDLHPDFEPDASDFLFEQYSLVALQRHLKHLGTFGFLHGNGDSSRLQYLPRTIGYLRNNLAKFDETQAVTPVLETLFEAALKKIN
jgi:aminoglycoside/choline kinase family phosphotransferase